MAAARATFDFFEAQRAARRRSALLLLYYLLALPAVAALVYLALWVLLAGASSADLAGPLWRPELGLAAAAVTGAVVGAGTLYHAWSLAQGGGEGLARRLGGEPVALDPAGDGDRRLRNVVEEMAIAAGLPVPAVWVLRGEPSVNAFAAGFAPDRAVVAVTQGCLDRLDRDQLQGVVAHELSHVQNGDMRLNLRLMALAGGLSALALVGRHLVSAGSGGSSRRRRGGDGRLFLVGLLVLAAGSAGALFARLIRAAVARQREYLADAASAQFTRNPSALAGALRAILEAGSALHSPLAPEASHLLFAEGRARSWLADHPPPEERIRRLLALPQGAPLPPARPAAPAGVAQPPASPGAALAGEGAPAWSWAAPPLVAGPPEAASPAGPPPVAAPAASGGTHADSPRIRTAAALLEGLPPELVAATREPFGARALACAVLLDARPEVRARQLALLGEGPGPAEVCRLAPLVAAAGREHRLALLDLSLTALGSLSAPQREALHVDLRRLAEADGRLSVTEWAYLRVVSRRLDRLATGGRPARPRAFALEQVAVECRELLGLLARTGAPDEAAAQAALDTGVAALGLLGPWRLPRAGELVPARLDRTLAALEATPLELRARVLRACEACAAADGRLSPGELELLRVLAEALGAPRPPPLPAT